MARGLVISGGGRALLARQQPMSFAQMKLQANEKGAIPPSDGATSSKCLDIPITIPRTLLYRADTCSTDANNNEQNEDCLRMSVNNDRTLL